MIDFSKEQFQNFWGTNGYYENFQWGVGIDKVVEVSVEPFYNLEKVALELGPGGGVFTEKMKDRFKHLYAIDVIQKPSNFNDWQNFTYVELPDKDYACKGIKSNSIDYCFSYGMFCHLSNDALVEYFKNVYRVLKKGGDFVFMLSNYSKMLSYYPLDANVDKLGTCLSSGHFMQDDRTIDLVVDNRFTIVSRNLIPEHRDIIVHAKK
jgi:SAM-dependent methyltransferase